MPKETIGELRSRVNNWNIKHGLETGEEVNKTKGETCLFCDGYEKGHPRGAEYVCSDCITLLLDVSQENKRKAYDKAVKVNSKRQAKALLKFIIPTDEEEFKNEQRKPDTKNRQLSDRKRNGRLVGSEQKPVRGFKKKGRSPVY